MDRPSLSVSFRSGQIRPRVLVFVGFGYNDPTDSERTRNALARAAAGLFVSNSGCNRLRISARYLVSNSAESHGNI